MSAPRTGAGYLDLPVYKYGDDLGAFPTHQQILRLIAAHEPMPWPNLCAHAGVSFAIVRAAVDDLLDAGMAQTTNVGLRCTVTLP